MNGAPQTRRRGELLQGRYEPLEVIGRGGQGEVVRAVDHGRGCQVALKLRAVGAACERQAVRGEAQVLLGLRPHPGLPLVREDFFCGDRHVMVMDWIEGPNLAWLLARQGRPGLPFPHALDWLRQAADVLDHLHGHPTSIVHGDVNPANLVLAPGGRVRLVDFGIAGPVGARPLQPWGTAGYTAPELATSEPLTPAVDVFGLAATAVALATGAPPDGTRPRWECLTKAQATALERSARAGLAIDPSHRPPSASALLDNLSVGASSQSSL